MNLLDGWLIILLRLLHSDLAGCSVQPYAEPVAKVLNHQVEKIFGTSQVSQIDLQSLNEDYHKARGKGKIPKSEHFI